MPHTVTDRRGASDRRVFLSTAGAAGLGAILATGWQPGEGAEPKKIAKELIVRTESPRNAEPALDKLVASWITPIEHFYVRSHAPNPELDARTFQVTVEGLVDKPLRLSLDDLKRFPNVTATATLTCAGNRRNEHHKIKPVGGVLWDAGPIGNARWTGVPLSAVLKSAGLRSGAKHVWFESVDKIEKGDQVIPFGASIPLEKALDDRAQTPGAMLAHGMNGQPLLPDHGYPLRSLVPGYIGARSVKWLGRIVVSDRPSPNHYLAGAYKVVTVGSKQEWAAADPIYSFPINSAICVPGRDAQVATGKLRVAGYALAPGQASRQIQSVFCSVDGGKQWIPARLQEEAQDFCWRLWQADVQVGKQTRELLVRAVDSSGTSQPKTAPWNLKGYLYNGYHHVPLRVS